MKFFIRLYTYFRRGWSLISIPVAFTNFDLITYRLLVEHVPVLRSIFPSLLVYTVALIVVGVPVLMVGGYLDLKYGTAPFETTRISENSPWHRSLMRALKYMVEGKNEEARKELEQWVER